MTVQHSSKSNEHYTPPAVIAAARATMGEIDLDPFSCELANEEVQAAFYYIGSGFQKNWNIERSVGAKVLVNPPGGLVDRDTHEPAKPGARNAMSSAAAGWRKLYLEWEKGNVEQAIFVCFNLEVLRLTQHLPGVVPACAFPICFLKERLRFWNETHTPEERGQKGAPSHPNAAVYLPERNVPAISGAKFSRYFSPLGYVRL